MDAKTKEVAALSGSIEVKSKRVGELGVQVASEQHDLEDTRDALGEDKKFLLDLQKDCDSKAKEWDERTATRTEELATLAETIKVLNDDDALELFKKALPSP